MNIYNIIILDSSGSMSPLQKPSVDGVNETIQTIRAAWKEDPRHKQFLSLFSFSSVFPENLRTLINVTPIEEVQELAYREYDPEGGTPLYDALGEILNRFRKMMGPDDKGLVTIITDGYENSSMRYNAMDIKKLISALTETGWIFAYIGANQESIIEAGRIGISNSLDFDACPSGTGQMWEKERASRRKYLDALKKVDDSETYDEIMSEIRMSYFKEFPD